jgi:uncharacterized protein YecT (DUF1311 family)
MILTLALALAAQAADIDCDNPGGQLENTECVAREFQREDAELNRRRPEWLQRARAADRDFAGRREGPGYEQVLRDAQRAWIAFRDANCRYDAYSQARGGTLEPLIYENCRLRMTRERIRVLTDGDRTLSQQ